MAKKRTAPKRTSAKGRSAKRSSNIRGPEATPPRAPQGRPGFEYYPAQGRPGFEVMDYRDKLDGTVRPFQRPPHERQTGQAAQRVPKNPTRHERIGRPTPSSGITDTFSPEVTPGRYDVAVYYQKNIDKNLKTPPHRPRGLSGPGPGYGGVAQPADPTPGTPRMTG